MMMGVSEELGCFQCGELCNKVFGVGGAWRKEFRPSLGSVKVEAEGIIAGVLANVGHDGGMTAREGASSAWLLWAASAHLALFGHGGVVRRALGSCAHTGASPMFPRITILSRRSRAPSRCLGGEKTWDR